MTHMNHETPSGTTEGEEGNQGTGTSIIGRI